MKPQLGMVRKKEMEFGSESGGAVGVIGARENRVADASALLFQTVKQAARPDELRCQNSQSEQDRQPARTRSNNHHDAECKQRESEENLHEAFGLLQTSNEHLFGPLHPFRCAVRKSDTEIFPARRLPITRHVASRKFPFKKGFRQTYGQSTFPLDSILGIFPRVRDENMDLLNVRLEIPKDANLILGQSHFIKTAEDLYEVVVNTVPGAKFAVAFNEASGPCLVRVESNDDELRRAAVSNAQAIGAGHVFVLLIRQAYPINLLSRVRDCFEVCTIFCATANPVEAIVAQTEQGRAVLGVVDGSSSKGIESPEQAAQRREFVRKIGYKL